MVIFFFKQKTAYEVRISDGSSGVCSSDPAAGLAGTERMGISARDVRGSIWGGRSDQLMLGRLPMGSVRVALTPEALLLGRARFDIWRRVGQADDVAGAMTVGVGRIGIDDVTGSLPLGRAFAPLPIGS